jgi:predicted aldo/keto reductase-like oxidoreductase
MTHPTVIKLSDGNVMPQLGLGVWKAGNEEVVSAIHKALEVGYRSIDTAAAYKNEDGVGTALKVQALRVMTCSLPQNCGMTIRNAHGSIAGKPRETPARLC